MNEKEIPFHQLMDMMVNQYTALEQENEKLRLQIAKIKARLNEKNPNSNPKSQGSEIYPSTPSKKPSLRKMKIRINAEWNPISFDFSDSVLCTSVQDDIVSFGIADSTVQLFYNDSFSYLTSYSGHRGAINSIVVNPTTKLYATCSGDCTAHVWSPKIPENYSLPSHRSSIGPSEITTNIILKQHTGSVTCGIWLSKEVLITGSYDSTLCTWDISHSASCQHSEEVSSGIISADKIIGTDNCYVIGAQDGNVLMYDMRTQNSIRNLIHLKGQCTTIKSIDERTIIVGGVDKMVHKFDLKGNGELFTFDIEHVPTKMDCCGGYAIVPNETGKPRVINLNKGVIAYFDSMPFSYTVSSASWLVNDGTKALMASWDGSAYIAQFSSL